MRSCRLLIKSDLTKNVLCTEPGGSGDRKRGRPKFRRCEEFEVDVAKFGRRHWRINAQLREKWRKLTEEVKCL
jgi:hypothetical protein